MYQRILIVSGGSIEDAFAEKFIKGEISSGETVVCYAQNGEVHYRKNVPAIMPAK